jgi:hypothetical protein
MDLGLTSEAADIALGVMAEAMATKATRSIVIMAEVVEETLLHPCQTTTVVMAAMAMTAAETTAQIWELSFT